ncbi:LPS export ABC transporter periplasmic protein LptC [bacterium]|nr:LPS export ABC transporter periplasmic protein LptC [bacterium]
MKYINLFQRKLKAYRKTIKKIYKQKTAHSRLVFLLKIALPSIVAVFLGIIILTPQLNEIKKIKIDIPKLESSDKISFTMDNSSFYGQGDNGMMYSVNIKNFQENRVDDLMYFSNIDAKLFFKDASWINLTTDKGTYTKKDGNMLLSGNIYLVDNDNNEVFTDEAIIKLNSSEVEGSKPIKANTYFGVINGEGFNFKKDDKYIFNGKIKANIDTNKLGDKK